MELKRLPQTVAAPRIITPPPAPRDQQYAEAQPSGWFLPHRPLFPQAAAVFSSLPKKGQFIQRKARVPQSLFAQTASKDCETHGGGSPYAEQDDLCASRCNGCHRGGACRLCDYEPAFAGGAVACLKGTGP